MISNNQKVELYKEKCPASYGNFVSVFFALPDFFIPGNSPAIYLKLFPSDLVKYAVYTSEDGNNDVCTVFNVKSNIIAN